MGKKLTNLIRIVYATMNIREDGLRANMSRVEKMTEKKTNKVVLNVLVLVVMVGRDMRDQNDRV